MVSSYKVMECVCVVQSVILKLDWDKLTVRWCVCWVKNVIKSFSLLLCLYLNFRINVLRGITTGEEFLFELDFHSRWLLNKKAKDSDKWWVLYATIYACKAKFVLNRSYDFIGDLFSTSKFRNVRVDRGGGGGDEWGTELHKSFMWTLKTTW